MLINISAADGSMYGSVAWFVAGSASGSTEEFVDDFIAGFIDNFVNGFVGAFADFSQVASLQRTASTRNSLPCLIYVHRHHGR